MQPETARYILASVFESLSAKLRKENSAPFPDARKIISYQRRLNGLIRCRNNIDAPQVLQKIERVYGAYLKN